MVADSRPQPSPPKRSFIARFFIGLFKFILLIAVIAAGVALGLFALTWINLSTATDDAQNQRIDGLQDEVAKQSVLARQIAELSIQANGMTTEMDSIGEDAVALAADLSALSEQVAAQSALLEAQETQIATLTDAQTGILDDLAAAQNDVEDLVETTAGLRRNLTTSSQSASDVNNSLASLEAQVTALETSLAEIESTATLTGTAAVADGEPAEVVEGSVAVADASVGSGADLTLVRILGQIARAKIHLLESDSVSAAGAIDSALALTTGLADSASDEQSELLATLVENLEAAQANLESKPTASTIALDAAWDSLDEILTSLSN